MATLVFCEGPSQGQQLELRRGTNLIGRAFDCNCVIEDGTVSGRHAELNVSDFGVKVRDLGSSNGTYIDRQRVQEGELKDGQQLTLGRVVLRLQLEPVHIAIPELPVVEAFPPTHLPDGTAACHHHSEVAATHQCVQCARTFCPACVKSLGLVGRQARRLCPVCSGVCQPLGPAPARKRKKSLVRRVLDTIRIPFRREPPGDTGPRP